MTEHHQHSRNRALIEREAVAWFTRMNGRPSREDQRNFDSWLQTSPDHQDIYDEVRSLWSDLGSSPHLSDDSGDLNLQGPLERIRRYRNERRMTKAGGIVVGCLLAILGSCWFWLERPNFLQDMQADFVSPRGERREITLDDGSRVLMDADSALDVALASTERRVRLLRGTAFFEVTHLGTPFVVEAQNGEARVLGTEFDVSMKEDRRVTVTLARGRVAVGVVNQPAEATLKPGETIDYGETGLGPVREAVIEDEMAWHQGRFIFNNARLADVLAQIERYRDGRIVVLRSALGELRVSGNIALDDTDKALAAVQSSVHFPMYRLGKVTVVGP